MEVDHKRTGLLPAAAVRALGRRSDAAGSLRLTGHLAVWVAAGAVTWSSIGTWWVLPAMLVQGIVQVALFAGLHECVHRTAFKARLANDLIAAGIGLIHVLPAGYFRRFHFAHHRDTQDPKRDPELATAKPVTRARYLLYLTAWFYWRDRLSELARNAAGRVTAAFVPTAERHRIVVEARWHLGLYLGLAGFSLAFGRAEMLYLWVLPAVLGQPLLRLYLLAEHTGCALSDDMLANSRTTYANPLIRFLMWNMPYHVEHHTYPAVPFHALPRLNRLMAADLQVTASGYGETHRAYWRALARGRGRAFTMPAIP